MYNRFAQIKYTLDHRKAFRKVEMKLLNKEFPSMRAWLHDLDKVFLYLVFPKKKAHTIHRKIARHHIKNKTNISRRDYIEAIIDWECARFTKPDKPLNAFDTLYKYYPDHANEVIPIMHELGLGKYPNGDLVKDLD